MRHKILKVYPSYLVTMHKPKMQEGLQTKKPDLQKQIREAVYPQIPIQGVLPKTPQLPHFLVIASQ